MYQNGVRYTAYVCSCIHILMIREDHSKYCWLYATYEIAAEQASNLIIYRCAPFGTPKQLISDGPRHFKNDSIRMLTRALQVPHHFTLPYTPWSNDGFERLGKELLRNFRALVSELGIWFGEWTDLLPLVQSALNNEPSPERKKITPIRAFTGMEPSTPISTFSRSETMESVTYRSWTTYWATAHEYWLVSCPILQLTKYVSEYLSNYTKKYQLE